MSDIYVWRSPETVDDALRELTNYRRELRYMVHEFDRDDPRRELVLTVWGSLEEVEKRMRHVLTAPVPTAARPVPSTAGEDTRAWIAQRVPHMRRNGGPQR